MADNRLFIVDTETGERFCLAKSLSNGWYMNGDTRDEFEKWADGRDIEASYGRGRTTSFVLVCENEHLEKESDGMNNKWTVAATGAVICFDCDPPHQENCRTCFGWGLCGDVPITADQVLYKTGDVAVSYRKCPECGGTPNNEHLKKMMDSDA